MRISSRSWHLRLVRMYSSEYRPRDLCSYFWTVVSVIGLTALLGVLSPLWWPLSKLGNIKPSARVRKVGNAIGMCAAGLMVLIGVAALVVSLYSLWMNFGAVWAWLVDHLDNIGWTVLVAVVVLAVGVAISWVSTEFQRVPRPRPSPKQRKPNLAWEYVKAKKRRVCPLIEVKEAEEVMPISQ